MQRVAFRLRVKPGKLEDYVKIHTEVWPELLADLHDAGYRNYSIFADGVELFGYFECDDVDAATGAMAMSDVNRRWQARMQEYLTTPLDDEGLPLFTFMPQVFFME